MLERVKESLLVKRILENIKEYNINVFAICFLFILQTIIFVIFYGSIKASILSFGIVTDLSFIIFVYFICFYLMKFKIGKIFFCIFTFTTNIIICADIMYYQYFSDIIGVLDLWNLRWLEGGYGVSIPFQVIVVLLLNVIILSITILYTKISNILKQKNHSKQIVDVLRQEKIIKGVYIAIVSIFAIFFIQAFFNNIAMMFRPDFDTIHEYYISKFYNYDQISNASKFTQNWGYWYYRVVDFLRWLF